MLARLFLLALVVYAVVVIVQRFREQQRLERDERAPVEQRLAQLDDLLRRELITRTEYDAARLRIIAGEDPD